MTISLNRIALDVIHDLADAPGPLIERDARFAAIEFCDFTLTWRVKLADVPGVAGEYVIALPADSRVSTVFYAAHDGLRLLPTTERQMDDSASNWRTQTAAAASWYYLADRSTIKLVLTPDVAAELSLTVALKPTQECKTLPDELFQDHMEALRAGTLARMLSQPGKAWSNPQLGAYNRSLFERAKRKEKAERWNDYTRTSTLSIVPKLNG